MLVAQGAFVFDCSFVERRSTYALGDDLSNSNFKARFFALAGCGGRVATRPFVTVSESAGNSIHSPGDFQFKQQNFWRES